MAIRKIGIASRTYRHVNRYRQILTVLFRYGFDELVDKLNVNQYVEIGLQMITRKKREHVEKLSTAERVRLILEELGPTFVKLGQVLSTRPDLVPAEFLAELAKLQQHVPPFPFEDVQQIVEEDLGQPMEQRFEAFDREPIAAASIGQVHRARLRDGEDVVVKVRRPNIEELIEVDLEIALHLATLAEEHIEDLRVYRPREIIEHFARVVEREQDYKSEANHIERFASQFLDDKTVYVPKVFRQYTTRRVLTLEYVDVQSVSDVAKLRQRGYDPRVIAARGTEIVLKQIFVHGFFHADPHPGNVFALPGNVVCFLDFGMMGRLDREGRELFADLIYAVGEHDERAATAALLRITTHPDDVDPDVRRIESQVAELIDLNISTSLADLDFSKLMYDLMGLVRQHQLTIPADFVMMMKAAATAEQLVTRLDSELNVIAAAKPYVRKLKLDRLRPKRLFGELFSSTGELFRLAREIPGGIRDILRLSKHGSLRIGLEHRGLEELLDTLERVASRVSFAIIVGALIVGSSLIVHAGLPPTWHDIPVIGLIGYVAAGLMGFGMLLTIIRRGRH